MSLVNPVEIEGITVDSTWLSARDTASIHLLPARAATTCIVIRRKPSKRFHVMRWNLIDDVIDEGSWFRGKLYPLRCDVSWDGRWMVYLAMGSDGRTWNGVCEPPWLKTVVDCPNVGTWAGGGVFTGPAVLEANTHWHADESLADRPPVLGLTITRRDSGGEDEPVLYSRLERDGWRRRGEAYGTSHRLTTIPNKSFVANLGDDGWEWRPTRKHPVLVMKYRGYFERGRTFEFELEGSSLLDTTVDWATWSSSGDLLVARGGGIERYTLRDLERNQPTFRRDLAALAPPVKS